MFGEKETRKLILVCAKDTKKYGMYLMQLIGAKDDADGHVVGLEDGSIEAVLWTEEEYESNRPTISSSARILFIGSSKLMMDVKANMDERFSKYGMRFDSLGNYAVMYLDKSALSKKEYKEFLSFAQEYQKQLNDLNASFNVDAGAAVAGTRIAGVKIAAGVVGLSFSNPVTLAGIGIPAIGIPAIGIPAMVISMKKNAEEIRTQRFSFLTYYAYLELLPAFMEE